MSNRMSVDSCETGFDVNSVVTNRRHCCAPLSHGMKASLILRGHGDIADQPVVVVNLLAMEIGILKLLRSSRLGMLS